MSDGFRPIAGLVPRPASRAPYLCGRAHRRRRRRRNRGALTRAHPIAAAAITGADPGDPDVAEAIVRSGPGGGTNSIVPVALACTRVCANAKARWPGHRVGAHDEATVRRSRHPTREPDAGSAVRAGVDGALHESVGFRSAEIPAAVSPVRDLRSVSIPTGGSHDGQRLSRHRDRWCE